MRIIYLDNDGVICLMDQFGGRFKKNGTESVYDRFDDFDKKAIKVLNEILEETGAEIVVSSDWKNFATIEELGDYYESQGLTKRPIDTTSRIMNLDKYPNFPWDRNYELEQTRSLEILEYLELHPEITHWVAIDDLDLSERDNGWGLRNFVHTPRPREGIKQCGIKESMIRFLS